MLRQRLGVVLGLLLLVGCDAGGGSTAPGKVKSVKGVGLDEPGKQLIVFHAAWCGPCRTQKPIVDDVAKQFPDVKFRRIDVDEQPQIAQELGINSIPCLLVVVDGEIRQRFVGLQSKDKLTQALKAL